MLKKLILVFAALVILLVILLVTKGPPKAVVENTPQPTPQQQTVDAAFIAEVPTSTPEPTPIPTATPAPSPKPTQIFDKSYTSLPIDAKFVVLKEYFPQDSYWNTYSLNQTGLTEDEICSYSSSVPCSHSEIGVDYCQYYIGVTDDLFGVWGSIQCQGFASMVSDFLFGKEAPLNVFYDFSQLQVGDNIRLTEYEHSMIVTTVNPGSITVLECNENYEDCRIEWGRVITEEELNSYNYFCVTRLPQEDADS